MASLLQRLKERKLGQWALAYLAGAFVVFQLLDALETPLGLTANLQQAILVIIGLGFFVTLVLAWYHGEKGQQRVSGPELLMIALLLVIAGGVISTLGGGEEESQLPEVTASLLNEDDRPGIAVLPCENWSTEPDDAYLALGLHDEILLRLHGISSLFSIGRTSVEWYRDNPAPLTQVAQELRVGFVGECSVQKHEDQIRLTFQLLDGRTGGQIWADSYDHDLTLGNLLEIQSDIAQQIANEIGALLTPEEQARIAAKPTENTEAYLLYVQALEYFRRPAFQQHNWEIAQGLLERALALDSDFAAAHALLSRIHGFVWLARYDPSSDRLIHAREEAETAVRLAPDLPQAHGAMGWFHYVRRDWQAALEEYGIALQGLPSDGDLWGLIGFTHRRLGNWDEVEAAYQKATQLDPRNADLHWDLGAYTYHVTRRYTQAIAAYNRALMLVPDFESAAVFKGFAYFDWKGELDTLRAILDQLPLDAADLGAIGPARAQQAQRLLWERKPDSLLALLGSTPDAVLQGFEFFLPSSLYVAWAHELRGDEAAARVAFDSARLQLDSVLVGLPDDWRIHAARGLALAGLGWWQEALREAQWLQQSVVYGEDPWEGPLLAEERAQILAKAGEVDAALDEIEQLLARPSYLSVQQLRLDPRWDPLRSHARFQAFLER